MDQDQRCSPGKMDSPKAHNPYTVVTAKNNTPPLEGGNYMKIGVMCTLKPEIGPPKFYELLVKSKLKVDTDLYLNNLYDHINMCLNVVIILRKYLLPAYRPIKRHFKFQ